MCGASMAAKLLHLGCWCWQRKVFLELLNHEVSLLYVIVFDNHVPPVTCDDVLTCC